MRKPTPIPSQKYLNECFDYDPVTGDMFWKERPLDHFETEAQWKRMNTRCKGKKLGYIHKGANNYDSIRIRLDGISYIQSRIIWKMVTGQEPLVIDHINGDSTDNRFINIRNVNLGDNQMNRKVSKNNKTGFTGVDISKGKYRARIYKSGKDYSLGVFDNITDALLARKAAESELHFI
ncbi:HNH endonuclease [Vibrio breoganii]